MHDYMTTSILFGFISKINTGNIIFDILIILTCVVIMSVMTNEQFKYGVYDKYKYFSKYFDKYNYLTIKCENTCLSTRFKAVMHSISINNNKTINGVIENMHTKWSNKTQNFEEDKNVTWKINQVTSFIINDNIIGNVYYYQKEKYSMNEGKMSYVDMSEIILKSSSLSTKQLTDWVNKQLEAHEIFIKNRILDKQYIIEVTYNTKINDIEYLYTPWTSNVTFENRFFTNKDTIVDKINFFINNPEWYKARGIPYTLGILLWGEPGCGKTGFIKSIMNLTGRHGINIKLNNNFDMNLLKDIIYDEEIGSDLVIPQDKRIIIFEDIDCMSDIVTDRDTKKNKKNVDNTNDVSRLITHLCNKEEKIEKSSNNNNNLSYLLNILDGLQECTGRIIIMTTNKPEMLDKALVRPGRIDYKIHMKKATTDDIINIINFYWEAKGKYILENKMNEKYSHADIVNFCRTSNSLLETLSKL
jgi:ATP-dependent 26S proteasome regulatory subunit